jgi:hypothetical protein
MRINQFTRLISAAAAEPQSKHNTIVTSNVCCPSLPMSVVSAGRYLIRITLRLSKLPSEWFVAWPPKKVQGAGGSGRFQ